MHVLIVGINYAPESTGIAPYTTQLAEHLAVTNEVTVVTGMPHYPQWKVPSEYRRRFRAEEKRAGVQLRRVRQYTPADQTALGRSMYEISFFLQSATQKLVSKPDCVVGVVPSLAGAAAAALYSRRHRVPLGLIMQDLVGPAAAQSGVPGGGLAARPARALEGWVSREADGVVIVAEAFRSYLLRAGVSSERIVHIPNWSHGQRTNNQPSQVREKLGWPSGTQIILHAGNMGYKQGLQNVLDTARLAEDRGHPFIFVLMGAGNDRRRLIESAHPLKGVQFLDPVPDEDFIDVLSAADVLLVNERATVIEMSLPSKIGSYFRAGRPVVAAVPAAGSTARELTRSGGALIADAEDPSGLLDAIISVVADPALGGKLVDNATKYAAKHLDKSRSLDNIEHFLNGLSRSAHSQA